jgi:acyl carrier protein
VTPAELRRLHSVTAEVMGVEPDELEPDTDFYEDLNADRDELADLFVAIEDAFGVGFADSTLEAVRTVRDLEELLDEQIA